MFGRQLLTGNQYILPTRVSADGRPKYKSGGVTVDWTTVTATGSNAGSVTTLADGSVINGVQSLLRYGQIITKITGTGTNKTGYFGPYDSAALDGRQTLTRGECFIVDETVLQYGTGMAGNSVVNDQIGGVFDAGEAFLDRIIQSGTATASLALGPTKVNFLAAFPAVTVVEN